MDFKNFKKLHSDDKTTTFVHKDGHQIKVAHSRLDKKMQQQMAELPKFAGGGWVDKLETALFPKPSKAEKKIQETREPKAETTPNKDAVNAFQQGFRKKTGYAEGGSVPEIDLNMLPGQAGGAQAQMPVMQPQSEMSFNLGTGSTMPSQPMEQATPISEQYSNVPLQAPAPESNMAMPVDYSGQMEQGLNEQMQGIEMQGQVESQMGREKASAAQQQVHQAQELMNSYKQHEAELLSERQAVTNDYKAGHIDPSHFMSSRTPLDKVAISIGLILGGIGGQGRGNMALDFLNKQIDNDIEAQKAELGKKHNLLSANMEQFRNMRDATTMSKLLMSDVYAAKLEQAADKAVDMQAKSRALQAAGQLRQASAPLMAQLAQRQALIKGMEKGAVNPGLAIQHLVPKEQQDEAFKELGKQQESQKSLKNMSNIFNRIDSLQHVGNRVMNPFDSKSEIEALNTAIIAELKPVFGVLSESDKAQVEKNKINIMDSPAVRQAKKQFFLNLMDKDVSPILNSYGIKLPKVNTSVRPNTNTTRGK